MEQIISLLIGISLNFKICIPAAIACILMLQNTISNYTIISISYGLSSLLLCDKYSWINGAIKFVISHGFNIKKYIDLIDYILENYDCPTQFYELRNYCKYVCDNNEKINQIGSQFNISFKDAVLYSNINCDPIEFPSYDDLESAEKSISVTKLDILKKLTQMEDKKDLYNAVAIVTSDKLEKWYGDCTSLNSLQEEIRKEKKYFVYFRDFDYESMTDYEIIYAKNNDELAKKVISLDHIKDYIFEVDHNGNSFYFFVEGEIKWITEYEYFLRLHKNKIKQILDQEIPEGDTEMLYPALIEVLLEGPILESMEDVETEIINIIQGDDCQKYEAIEVESGDNLGEFICISWKSAEELAKESLQQKNPTSKSQIRLKKGNQEKII